MYAVSWQIMASRCVRVARMSHRSLWMQFPFSRRLIKLDSGRDDDRRRGGFRHRHGDTTATPARASMVSDG